MNKNSLSPSLDNTLDACSDEDLLEKIQYDSFHFFHIFACRENGLVPDSNKEGSACSTAAVGFALSSYPVAVERGWISRGEALALTLAALRFFDTTEKGDTPRRIGHKGFFFHFLDMVSGERVNDCELSVIDTALLLAGILFSARYFDGVDAKEEEVRRRALAIYSRVDWRWMQNGGAALALAWTPEKGFSRYRWIGYCEALVLYVLALGSPTHAVDPHAYSAWLSGYRWKKVYGYSYVYAGPLFIHQFSHIWIDFRDLRDAYMAEKGLDYFENSRRATCVHREYARRNPHHFDSYHGSCWGLTASNGPGPLVRRIHGRERKFFGYRARGAPYGPDDGTVSPWAAIASLPFAPELVLPTTRYLATRTYDTNSSFGFYSSFNPTLKKDGKGVGWLSSSRYSLNQGPIVLMIENYRSEFVWRLMRECPFIRQGLLRAGFSGGWLK